MHKCVKCGNPIIHQEDVKSSMCVICRRQSANCKKCGTSLCNSTEKMAGLCSTCSINKVR